MREGSCIHFNGLMSHTCKVDHAYLDVAAPITAQQLQWHNENYPTHDPTRTAIAKRIPCLVENNIHTCPDFREPTPEEIEANEKQIGTMLSHFVTVRTQIIAHIKENGQEKNSWQSSIPCPVCEGGTVKYTYAGNFNRHIHARCTTPNCVNWME